MATATRSARSVRGDLSVLFFSTLLASRGDCILKELLYYVRHWRCARHNSRVRELMVHTREPGEPCSRWTGVRSRVSRYPVARGGWIPGCGGMAVGIARCHIRYTDGGT